MVLYEWGEWITLKNVEIDVMLDIKHIVQLCLVKARVLSLLGHVGRMRLERLPRPCWEERRYEQDLEVMTEMVRGLGGRPGVFWM